MMIKLTDIMMLNESKEEKLALEFISNMIRKSKFKGKVFLAGGAVRDELLGLDAKDIDLVVSLPDGGIEFAKWVTKKIGNYSKGNPVIFPRFGTAKFTLKGVVYKGVDLSSIDIEAVMTRSEKYTDGSRKPDVTHGSLKDDVERRDFTVNSLLKDLTTGEILDLTGRGRSDIEKGIIMTPLDPDVIFSEDPLRMLRAIRFTVKYNWKLPLFMIRAIKKNSDKIKTISAERIRDELDKMMVTGHPDKAIRLMKITSLSKYVLPEFDKLVGLTQNKYHKDDAAKHTLKVLKGVPKDLKTRLAALFHDIGKAETREVIDNEVHFYRHEEVGGDIAREIMTRLKYPNDIIDAVVTAVRNHMRLKQSGKHGEVVSDKALRKLKRDLGDHLETTLNVMHSDNISHAYAHNMPNQIPGIRKRLSTLDQDVKSKSLPINGGDVMKVLGIKPGPIIGQLLTLVDDAWLENPRLTRDQAIDIIKKGYKRL